MSDNLISQIPISVTRSDFRQMLRLVRALYRLSQNPEYRQAVFSELPETARFDPGHGSLMMGYDFHLSDAGPKLIEVNTNAGGTYMTLQTELAGGGDSGAVDTERFKKRFLGSLLSDWRSFCGEEIRSLRRVAIVDEEPKNQPLYVEMEFIATWLVQQGLEVEILAPEELLVQEGGLYGKSGQIDLIYNRHCDFYLEDEVMGAIRTAYLARQVCLSPNPFAYGLLADKRRMILWSDAAEMAALGLTDNDRRLLASCVPQSRLLKDLDPDTVWAERKDSIFKPVSRFGGRGVLMGKSVSRKRFAELEPETTLVQQVVPPSVVTSEGEDFKVDIRLYVYRDKLLGVVARVYQGQVTNLNTERGGFARVRLV